MSSFSPPRSLNQILMFYRRDDEREIEGVQRMADSVFKSSKLQQKQVNPIIVLIVLFWVSGCATSPVERVSQANDSPGNIASAAQAAWQAHPYEATSDYHFALAQAYSTEGKVDRAIEEYRAALAYDPNSAILHAKVAAEYLKKGSTSFAIEECKKAIEIDPNYIDVRLMLGGIYSISNETDAALAEYDAVLKKQPSNDEAAVFKTQVLVEKERHDEALKFIRGYVAKVKDSAAAWFYAGKLEHHKNNVNEAIKDYRKALELRPGFSQATIALGMIFETHGETAKALELYEEQLDQKQDLQVAGRLATLYLKLNQLDLALKTLTVMTVIDPEDLNTQMKVGLIHMQKEDWEGAKKVFEGLLEKVPDSDKVNYYLAAVYEELGQIDLSISHLQRVSADSKLYEDANLHGSALYRKLQMKEKAYQLLQSAVQKSPENAGFYLVLASMYEDDKDVKNAVESLKSGLKIFPDHEKMRYFFGALLDKQGNTDEAIVEMEKVLKQNPSNADALNFVAYTWTSQGVRLKDAEEMLKRALKLRPDSPFILDSMGWNQFMLGHNQDALVYLEKAASLKQDETAILEHLVEVYAKNQMPERVQATKQKIQQILEQVGVTRMPASVK
jgi:tetratricopeptide (TPR) repeat protein